MQKNGEIYDWKWNVKIDEKLIKFYKNWWKIDKNW